MDHNESIEITVLNWSRHTTKDRKLSNKQFIFYSGFFSDEKISQLDRVSICFYIYLICVCCDFNSDKIIINRKTLPKSLRMSTKALFNAMHDLHSAGLIHSMRNCAKLNNQNHVKAESLRDNLPYCESFTLTI